MDLLQGVHHDLRRPFINLKVDDKSVSGALFAQPLH